jgi:hypothetical protein
MRDIEEFVDFEAEFEKELILSLQHFLFDVVVLVRVEFEFFDGANALIHLNKMRVTLKI